MQKTSYPSCNSRIFTGADYLDLIDHLGNCTGLFMTSSISLKHRNIFSSVVLWPRVMEYAFHSLFYLIHFLAFFKTQIKCCPLQEVYSNQPPSTEDAGSSASKLFYVHFVYILCFPFCVHIFPQQNVSSVRKMTAFLSYLYTHFLAWSLAYIITESENWKGYQQPSISILTHYSIASN